MGIIHLCGCDKNNENNQINKKNTNSNEINQIDESQNQKIEDLLSINKLFSKGRGKGNIKEKYDFGKKIGQGYYSEVYLCKNLITNKKVVIKIMKKKNQSLNKELLKKIDSLKILNHQNIMNIHEFYEGKINIYFINEYYKKGNLLNYCLRNKEITESLISIILFQILSAINYCHKQNIIHKDLKLENIMISDKTIFGFPFIKIIDFPTAIFIESEYKKNDLIGIPYYFAPEIFENNITYKSDIWSIGIILYYLITRKRLFEGKDYENLVNDIKNKEIDFNFIEFRNSSFEIKDLLIKLLKKNPNERINAEDALNHNFFNKYNTKDKLSQLSIEEIRKLLYNISKFKPKNSLEQILIVYLINKFSNEDIIKNASCLFLKLDKDNNGIIDQDEFVIGIKKLFQEDGKEINKEELIKLFNIIDTDKSSSIEYFEFIRASINKNEFVNEKIIKETFLHFQKDINEIISVEDICEFFEFRECFNQFKNIIEECNLDMNSSIDYNKFVKIIKKIIF